MASQTQNRTAHAHELAQTPLRNMFQLQGFIFPAALVGLVLSGLVLQGSGSVTQNSDSGSAVQPPSKAISSYIWKPIFPLGMQLAQLLTADMSFINFGWPIIVFPLHCCVLARFSSPLRHFLLYSSSLALLV